MPVLEIRSFVSRSLKLALVAVGFAWLAPQANALSIFDAYARVFEFDYEESVFGLAAANRQRIRQGISDSLAACSRDNFSQVTIEVFGYFDANFKAQNRDRQLTSQRLRIVKNYLDAIGIDPNSVSAHEPVARGEVVASKRSRDSDIVIEFVCRRATR